MLLVLTRGITQGWQAGVASALGVGAAAVVQVPVVVVGLGVILQQSPLAFTAVKLAGAAYLIFIGAKALLRSLQPPGEGPALVRTNRDAFAQGLLTNLLNPKVFLFMISFLPQFVESGPAPEWRQLLFFGVLMKLDGAVFLSACAIGAAWLRSWMGAHSAVLRWQDRALGCGMMAIGVLILFR